MLSTRPQCPRSFRGIRSATALVLLALLVTPALAKPPASNDDSNRVGTNYQVYDSHVEWLASPPPTIGDPSKPRYRVYPSHVEWASETRPSFPCHECKDMIPSPGPNYSWSDVVRFFSGP